jgi:hypothetical protein
VVARRAVEETRVGVAGTRWMHTHHAALVEEAEAATEEALAGKGTLQ